MQVVAWGSSTNLTPKSSARFRFPEFPEIEQFVRESQLGCDGRFSGLWCPALLRPVEVKQRTDEYGRACEAQAP